MLLRASLAAALAAVLTLGFATAHAHGWTKPNWCKTLGGEAAANSPSCQEPTGPCHDMEVEAGHLVGAWSVGRKYLQRQRYNRPITVRDSDALRAVSSTSHAQSMISAPNPDSRRSSTGRSPTGATFARSALTARTDTRCCGRWSTTADSPGTAGRSGSSAETADETRDCGEKRRCRAMKISLEEAIDLIGDIKNNLDRISDVIQHNTAPAQHSAVDPEPMDPQKQEAFEAAFGARRRSPLPTLRPGCDTKDCCCPDGRLAQYRAVPPPVVGRGRRSEPGRGRIWSHD